MEIERTTISIDEWDRIIIDKSGNQSKIIAKIDEAHFIERHIDGNIRTRIFKKGSVIKTIVDSNVEINSWNPDDEILDITTK